ncbi:hypothetical protein B9T33_03970 [Acinetobacter sp. ANC 5054]|nr:hypothetical protein B9T33_03970 [Acinetobacter sp. ANC 5054]
MKKIGFCIAIGGVLAPTMTYAKLQAYRINQPIAVDVVEITDLSNLQLYLNDKHGQPYQDFQRLKTSLQPICKKMEFAMNAGMYQANLSPVGLYIENGVQQKSLNRATKGFGNFLIQPNGVLAWNANQAIITTTQKYAASNFKARNATQSGPMLVIDGHMNQNFLAKSDSLKIRNGVGIKNGKLYFVISRTGVSFYAFAQYFKDNLGVKDALYLDGSISSAVISDLNRFDRNLRPLGPIVAYTPTFKCK